jgi:hypothetical protein
MGAAAAAAGRRGRSQYYPLRLKWRALLGIVT